MLGAQQDTPAHVTADRLPPKADEAPESGDQAIPPIFLTAGVRRQNCIHSAVKFFSHQTLAPSSRTPVRAVNRGHSAAAAAAGPYEAAAPCVCDDPMRTRLWEQLLAEAEAEARYRPEDDVLCIVDYTGVSLDGIDSVDGWVPLDYDIQGALAQTPACSTGTTAGDGAATASGASFTVAPWLVDEQAKAEARERAASSGYMGAMETLCMVSYTDDDEEQAHAAGALQA
jgi:hypothetical protein